MVSKIFQGLAKNFIRVFIIIKGKKKFFVKINMLCVSPIKKAYQELMDGNKPIVFVVEIDFVV